MIWRIWKRMLWSVLVLLLLVVSLVLSDGEGDFAEGMAALSLFLLFPLFFILFIWGIASSLKLSHRAQRGEDISFALQSRFKKMKEERTQLKAEVASMDAIHKKRFYLFRISGALLSILGLYFIFTCGWDVDTFRIVLGTIILIAGVTLWFSASPTSYNGSQGLVQMIQSKRPLTIEELYEAFKDVATTWGSPYLAKFSTMERPVLVLGPNEDEELVYAYLSKDNQTLYISSTFFTSFLKEKLSPQLHGPRLEDMQTMETLVCFSAASLFLKSQFFDSLKTYVESGEVKPFGTVLPKLTYAFDESFKLTGQRFTLRDIGGRTIYQVEGTYPLKTFSILDESGREVFSCTKEILNLMPTYRFKKDGQYYGTFSKQVDLSQDTFLMETEEGEVLMEEIGATIGANYRVARDGRNIGYVLGNLNLTLHNIVFDNSVLVLEDEKDLPLVTALGIMAARELARDRDR